MANAFPSYSNVFVPGYSSELSTRLAVEYTRNWKDFPINMLSTKTTIPTPSYLYKRINPAAQGRILSNPQAYEFADGQERPIDAESRADFDYVQVNATRYSFAHYVGDLEAEFSADDEVQRAINILGNKAMTSMADAWYTALTTSGNHISTHIDTATNFGGGAWSAATSSNRYIQKTLMAVRQLIRKDTMNGVSAEDMILLISPAVADGMARSQEISDGLFRTTDYKDHMQFKLFRDQWATWGLPPVLYGFTVIVDDMVKETARPLATSSKSFLSGTTSAFVISKPNALKGVNGNASFSSMHLFEPANHPLKVEVFDQPMHRRKLITAETFFSANVVSREGSAVITSAVS